MKKRLSRLLAFALVLCMCVSLMPAAFADDNEVEILFLDTSDVHGQQFATDYTKDQEQSGTHYQSMTRVATYIKQQRAEYENVFLSDSGDTVQGTPLTYYYAFMKKDVEDPAMKVMRMLDYDMWVVGNHEFNYGMDILQRQLDYLTSKSTETESQVGVSMANYLDASSNSDASRDWKTWNGYAPYVIKEYDGVKVAIMGIGNPNISNWDVPENWEGIYFAGVVETYKHYEKEMKEKANLIVLVSHSGIDGDSERSDFIRELVSTTDSIDLVFSGHEHRNGVTMITNTAGKEIPVISPSTKAAAVGRALFTYNKTTKEYTVDAQSVPMTEKRAALYEPDAELVAALQPYEDATWSEYMLQPIGSASGNFTASNLGTAPSAFVDLVNQAQIWGAYDRGGVNTPDDTSDDKPAQLSITAPLLSGNNENLIAEGEIVLGDMFALYRYENWFYQIQMSGKEVRTWLECSASKVVTNDDGSYGISGGLTYYDVIYGDGFSYVIDPTAPDGSRISSMTYNGKEVADDDTFTVVINNYRYNDGGNYITYLNEHGCNFTPNDDSRVIYSTQYDMIQGEDKGQARNILADYIKEQGTISPEIKSTWKIEAKGFENPFEDVSESAWYYDSVMQLAQSGVVKGTTAATFSPNATCTRAQAVTMLWRAAGCPEPTIKTTNFTDVKAGSFYEKAVLWAVEKGITEGTTKTTFSPDATCTRAQIVTFLWRANGSEEVRSWCNFTDVGQFNCYYAMSVSWAVEKGITKGTTDSTFSPNASCTRAQLAVFIARAA